MLKRILRFFYVRTGHAVRLPSSGGIKALCTYPGCAMLPAWQDIVFWLASAGVACAIKLFPLQQFLESLAGG